MGSKRGKGFYYYINEKQIRDYSKWSIERRLEWLYLGNLMRRSLPKRIIEIQESFRKNK